MPSPDLSLATETQIEITTALLRGDYRLARAQITLLEQLLPTPLEQQIYLPDSEDLL